MIVRILSSSSSFKGVNYNTNKIDQNKGELMTVKNFGPLEAMDRLRPEDYVNYLKMVSAQNKKVKSPQFHVAISTKGRSHNKDELTSIAEKWLLVMGYEKQPYLIIYHKDTKNNHVHIVSSRIDKNGLKISSAFEKNRAIQNLNKVLGLDPTLKAQTDLEKALAFNFSTKAQFKMILEAKGYKINEAGDKIEVIKFGEKLIEINASTLGEKLNGNDKDFERIKQLKAYFEKYSTIFNTTLVEQTTPLPRGGHKGKGSYTSEFSEFLNENFGLQLVFHLKGNQAAYGYSIIDHAKKNVFKGGEIMSLKTMHERAMPIQEPPEIIEKEPIEIQDLRQLKNGLTVKNSESGQPNNEYSDFQSGSKNPDAQIEPYSNDFIAGPNHNYLEPYPYETPIDINISDDIDDEAILGRNRRRQKKARTNTR